MQYSDLPEIKIPFFKCEEKDLFINCLGFNNFNYITSSKYFRVQTWNTLHIVLEGSGTLKVDKKTYSVKKGDMFFIPPDVNLCYFPDEDNIWKYAWFEFVGNNASLYAQYLGFTEENHVIKCRDFANVSLLLQRLFTNQMNNICVGYYDVLSAFYKILDTNIKEKATERPNLSEAVISYINCHYNKIGLSVPELCNYFNVSHSYLCRIFKKENSCSIKNYIIRVRINEACKLLENSSLGIKEIAYSVGYSDDIHFMKIFKKYIGKTPSKYTARVK